MLKHHKQNLQQLQQRSPEDHIIYFLENKKKQVFFGILFFAFLIRVQKFNIGLPYVLNPSEAQYLSDLLALVKNPFKPHFFNEPSFFLTINSIVLFLTSGTLNINNLINALESNPQALFIPLRVLSALFGIGSIVLIFLIGDLFGVLSGIFASAFLAVSFLHIKYCQIFSPFIPMTFFSLASILFALKAYGIKDEKTFRLYLISMVFAVLSTSMHYIGILSILPLMFTMLINKHEENLKTQLTYFLILFLVLNPYSIFSLINFIGTSLNRYVEGYYSYHYSTFINFMFSFLLQGIGPVVYFTALFFMRYKENYDENSLKLLFILPISYIGILGFMHIVEIPYAVLLIPFICLASALFFESFINDFPDKRFVFILLLLFALWIPFKYSEKYNRTISLPDTRVIATEWIRDNTTEDFSVAYDKNSIQPSWFDPYDKKALQNLIEDPDILNNPLKYEIKEKLLKNKKWFTLLKKKVDYVVINSVDEEKSFRKPEDSLEKKYYRKFQRLEPVIVFNPYLKEYDKKMHFSVLEDLYSPFETLWQRERSGPIIKIYKI